MRTERHLSIRPDAWDEVGCGAEKAGDSELGQGTISSREDPACGLPGQTGGAKSSKSG